MRGWPNEGDRHRLSALGIKTKAKGRNSYDYDKDEVEFHEAMRKEYDYIEELLKDKEFYRDPCDTRNKTLKKIFEDMLYENVRPILTSGDYSKSHKREPLIPSEGFGSFEVEYIDEDDNVFVTEDGFEFKYKIYSGHESDLPEKGIEIEVEYIPYKKR